MEQHPVPRNIAGFQFRLVGDMTLRQFGYLVAGAIIAYIVFRTAPFPPIISFPLAGLFGFIGIAFAFLPIQERPLDKWFVAFTKSITSPTQYTWRKINPAPEILTRPPTLQPQTRESKNFQNHHEEVKKKLHTYLATLPKTPHENINTKEKKYIESTLSLFYATTAPKPSVGLQKPISSSPPPYYSTQPQVQTVVQSAPPIPLGKQSPLKPTESKTQAQDTSENTRPATLAQQKVPTPPKPAIPTPQAQPAAPTNHQKKQLQSQLSRLTAEKKLLEEELVRLKQTLDKTKEAEVVKPAPSSVTAEPTIKTVTPKTAVSEIGIPALPQYPNMIVGAVKDPEGKILPNIILTIKDKSGLPLRALKTNKLGQFQTATPLPNGAYFLETEDTLKRYVFDIAEITLSGKVCLPIEITAKGEKELMREKLTKQLFGKQ